MVPPYKQFINTPAFSAIKCDKANKNPYMNRSMCTAKLTYKEHIEQI